MIKPPKREIGALTQTFLVASMWEKIIPNPPNAVMNEQIMVGLKADTPGIPEWS